jgi:hypothetical protein
MFRLYFLAPHPGSAPIVGKQEVGTLGRACGRKTRLAYFEPDTRELREKSTDLRLEKRLSSNAIAPHARKYDP